jgi:replicative DNA helicase
MATDIESEFFEHVIKHRVLDKAIDLQVKPELFSKHGRGRDVWEWLISFYRDYGTTPSRDALTKAHPHLDLEVGGGDPLPYLIRQLRDRHIHNLLHAGITDVAKAMKKKDPQEALAAWRQTLLEADQDATVSRDVDWTKRPEDRWEKYKKLQEVKGIDGLPTPWETLNMHTQGIHDEELWMIVARSSVGKTWAEVIMAHHIWAMGKSPLLISKEMSVYQILRRLDARHFRLAHQSLRAGHLGTYAEEEWQQGMDVLKEMHPFWVSGDDEASGVSGVSAKIDMYHPDICLVDGGDFLVDDRRGESDWQRMENVARDLKKVARRAGIPVVCTFQFNKKASNTRGGMANIARADIAKDADVILGVFQSEDQRELKEDEKEIIKQREGLRGVRFTCRSDFELMEFYEVDQEGRAREEGAKSDEEEEVKF